MENAGKECPNCGLYNPSNAMLCDCGFNFHKDEVVNPTNNIQDKTELNNKHLYYKKLSNIAASVWFISLFALLVLIPSTEGNIWDNHDYLQITVFSIYGISFFCGLWFFAKTISLQAGKTKRYPVRSAVIAFLIYSFLIAAHLIRTRYASIELIIFSSVIAGAVMIIATSCISFVIGYVGAKMFKTQYQNIYYPLLTTLLIIISILLAFSASQNVGV